MRIWHLLLAIAALGVAFTAQSPVSRLSKTDSVSLSRFQTVVRIPRAPDVPIPDNIRVSNSSSTEVRNSPVVVSRFFAPGEIPRVAAAMLDGSPLPTQCDVRTRWPDGSLQQAVLTFPLSLRPRSTVEVAFVPADSSAAGRPLDAAAMLSQEFQLGARMEIADGASTRVVDVRDLLAKGAFRYWLKGPLVTQVIAEDASPDPPFDLEFGGHKSFHPIFVLTFFPGRKSVRVEFIGENSWLTRQQDISYSLALFTGADRHAPPVYSRQNFLHISNTRWRKVFWSGPPLPPLDIDHNLPYLIYAGAVPSFDLSIPPPRTDEDIKPYLAKPQDELNGACLFSKYMPSTGGRPELGLFNRWDVRYLYTFDSKLLDVVLACADASAHFPIHLRESRPGRTFSVKGDPVTGESAPAVGRVVSIDARPGFCSRSGGIEFSSAADRPVRVGPVTTGGFTPDTAHQPLFTYVPYLLTGDWYYLEELYFWSAWNLASFTPGDCHYCRGSRAGPPGESFGVVHTSVNQRAVAWVLRTLLYTALAAPDGSPEKTYFTDKLLNSLAAHEGRFDLSEGVISADPSRREVWKFGRDVLANGRPIRLGFWCAPPSPDTLDADKGFIDASKAFSSTRPWMNYLIIDSVGLISDLGFPVRPLLNELGRFVLGQLTDPGFNPYLVESYGMPAGPAKWENFSSWAQVFDAYRPERRDRRSFAESSGPDFNYGLIALSSLSFLPALEQNGKTGAQVFEWLRSNHPKRDLLRDNPKWALVPRYVQVRGSISNPGSWARHFQERIRPLSPKRH